MSRERGRLDRITSLRVRRLLAATQAGDRRAEAELIGLHQHMVETAARRFYLPGASADDVRQEASIGLLDAIRNWEPARQVPFPAFAWLCIKREVMAALQAATRLKHQPLNRAVRLGDCESADQSRKRPGTRHPRLASVREPLDLVLAREHFSELARSVNGFSELECRSTCLHAAGLSHAEIAEQCRAPVESIDNALQRARRKLQGHLADAA